MEFLLEIGVVIIVKGYHHYLGLEVLKFSKSSLNHKKPLNLDNVGCFREFLHPVSKLIKTLRGLSEAKV